MHNNSKNENIYRSSLKLALTIVLILMLGLIFVRTWTTNYNIILRFPYVLKGNIFLMLVYMVLTYVFMILLDVNNFSEYRPANIIFSESLAVIFCNILVYFVIIIPAAALGLMPMLPLVFMTLIDILLIVFWAIITYYIYRKVFPAKELLLISTGSNIDEIAFKLTKRDDLYLIKEKVIYDDKDLDEIYSKCNNYDNILIGDVTSEIRNDIIKHCFDNSRNIYVVPKISDILLKFSEDILLFDMPIYLSTSFGLTIETKFFKRLIDIVISILVLVVFLPIWLLVALLIKIEDGGPVFFKQDRVTNDNKIFKVIKYRSMKVTDSKDVLPTVNDDDRITKIGKFIRKYHIDEVPQFINVLVGDMSIVGPRPERIEHVELYTKDISEFPYRSKVKAGITGLAQIYGKYNTSAIDKLKLDLIYIKKCSLIFDFELMLRTLRVLIMKENTEGFDVEKQEYIKENAK